MEEIIGILRIGLNYLIIHIYFSYAFGTTLIQLRSKERTR